MEAPASPTAGAGDRLQEDSASGSAPTTHLAPPPSVPGTHSGLEAPAPARGESEALRTGSHRGARPPRPPAGLNGPGQPGASGDFFDIASAESKAPSDASPARSSSSIASDASPARSFSGSTSTWSRTSSLQSSGTDRSSSINSRTTSSTDSDRRSASIGRSVGVWPPDYVGEASHASESDVLNVLKKGAAKNRHGVIPAAEFARVAAYTLRDAAVLERAVKRQAFRTGIPDRDPGFPFADTAHSVWSHDDDKVKKFHLEYHRHAQLQTLENNLTELLAAHVQHLSSEVAHAWVQQNGPGKLERLHGDIRALRQRSADSLQTREANLKERLTDAYARGNPHACSRPPVDRAVCDHVAQALVQRFNSFRDAPDEQAALANNPAWRELAAQVVHPALGFSYNVSSSSPASQATSPQLLSLLLNVTPEEDAMKIGNSTWRVDYFKRGREERAFAVRHVERGVAAILFHETKHVKKVNGSWSQAYDVELRKAAERLEKLLPT